MTKTTARPHRRTAALRRLAVVVAVPLCACASVPRLLRAQQVGTAPEQSPFKDILTHEGFTLFAGRFAGNASAAGTGARPGFMVGGRLQIRLSSALDVWATMGEVWTNRLRIHAGGDTARIMGNLNVRLIAADLSLAINLTGDKTWRGFAPYVGLGGGLATPSAKVVDPGGFELGTNFTIVPTIGTRFFISRSLALRLEARDYYYRYSFPLSFVGLPYAGHANYSPVNSLDVGDRVWYNNFTLWVGITYGFNF